LQNNQLFQSISGFQTFPFLQWLIDDLMIIL
jgi:hypothetical protein